MVGLTPFCAWLWPPFFDLSLHRSCSLLRVYTIILQVMTSTVDSKAAFKSMVVQMGLEAVWPKFEAQGWDTFGSFAFACSSGSAANEAELFKKEVIVPLVGEEIQHVARIRRLFNRAYALEQADTERALGGKPDEVFQLHPAEREDRRTKLSKRITGFALEGMSEPSNRLVDRFATMLQKNEVTYVDWEKCTTRASEMESVHTDEGLKFNPATGTLSIAPREDERTCSLSTDLLLDMGLRRRALAMDLAGLCTFETMTRWHETLKHSWMREPPAGHARTSLAQLRAADAELFLIVARACRDGVGRKPGDELTAFETAVRGNLDSNLDLRLMLVPPRASGAASSSSSGGNVGQGAGKSSKDPEKARLQNRLANLEQQLASVKKKHGKDKEVAKDFKPKGGKGNRANRNPNMPKELQGKRTSTDNGERICWDFNLGGCSKAPPGGTCPKGRHVCMQPGCNAPHSMRGNH